MTPEKILAQLESLGFNAVEVSLQNIEHKNGSTWAYTNRKPSMKATVFGDSTIDASFSVLRKGDNNVAQTNGDIYTIWLNKADDEEARMYTEDFGAKAVILLNDDNAELVSFKQAEELLIPQDVPSPSDSASQTA